MDVREELGRAWKAAQQDSLILPNGLDKKRKETMVRESVSEEDEPVGTESETIFGSVAISGTELAADEIETENDDDDWLIPAIEATGLEFIDKRDAGGNLWVIGDRKIVMTISELNK